MENNNEKDFLTKLFEVNNIETKGVEKIHINADPISFSCSNVYINPDLLKKLCLPIEDRNENSPTMKEEGNDIINITSRPWVFQDLLDDIKELAVSYNPNSETFTSLMMAHDFLESIPKAFRAANNAIYFNDSSDRLAALYDVCRALKPDQNEYGEEYIEE